MTEQLLSQYTGLVDFLGRVLGPDYEIILHEILPEQSRVAAIANVFRSTPFPAGSSAITPRIASTIVAR